TRALSATLAAVSPPSLRLSRSCGFKERPDVCYPLAHDATAVSSRSILHYISGGAFSLLRTEMPRVKPAEDYVEAIRALSTKFDSLSACFREGFTAGGDPHVDEFSADSLRRNTYG